jgi:cephalosporin hydroxylase
MNHILRMRIARIARFFRPSPTKIPLSVANILGDGLARSVVDQFHRLYYESGVAGSLQWRGIEMLKNPCDLWMLLELLQKIRPTVLVETGTHCGGSALYFAEMTKLLGHPCSVITVDINPKISFSPQQHGIVSIVGYSTAPGVVAAVNKTVRELVERTPGPVMVTLDSDHSEENVFHELELYSPLVTPNSYLVVEDTNVNGHPAGGDHGPGPWEAVQKFLANCKHFEPDLSCERHLLTFFPNGWLKRISE